MPHNSGGGHNPNVHTGTHTGWHSPSGERDGGGQLVCKADEELENVAPRGTAEGPEQVPFPWPRCLARGRDPDLSMP